MTASMMRRFGALFAAAALAQAGAALAQERIEGKVVGTKLTQCTFKPGGCEGTLTLERSSGGKTEELTVKVPLGTPITKAGETVFLPALRGRTVAVTLAREKNERVAKAIEQLR